ncbi:MAG: hypothetical protein V9E84_05330 [Trichococcus flocculiformis]
MATENISDLAPSDFLETYTEQLYRSIPAPANEPTIGVIDTLFDERVYFGKWVEFHNMMDENIPISSSDYNHGTAVSSIIVDGVAMNPKLDDGCGRFKVRHFGVATSRRLILFRLFVQSKKS